MEDGDPPILPAIGLIWAKSGVNPDGIAHVNVTRWTWVIGHMVWSILARGRTRHLGNKISRVRVEVDRRSG